MALPNSEHLRVFSGQRGATTATGGHMSNEVTKAIVRRWYDEFWNAGKLEVADELLHPDYVYQDGYGAGAPSVAANKEGHAIWHRILPDLHFTIEDMIAEGEAVVVRWMARGSHQG